MVLSFGVAEGVKARSAQSQGDDVLHGWGEGIDETELKGGIAVEPLAAHGIVWDAGTLRGDEGFEHAADVSDAALDVGALCFAEAGAFDARAFKLAVGEDIDFDAELGIHAADIFDGAHSADAAHHAALAAVDFRRSAGEPVGPGASVIDVADETLGSGEIHEDFRTIGHTSGSSARRVVADDDGMDISTNGESQGLLLQELDVVAATHGVERIEVLAKNAVHFEQGDAVGDLDIVEDIVITGVGRHDDLCRRGPDIQSWRAAIKRGIFKLPAEGEVFILPNEPGISVETGGDAMEWSFHGKKKEPSPDFRTRLGGLSISFGIVFRTGEIGLGIGRCRRGARRLKIGDGESTREDFFGSDFTDSEAGGLRLCEAFDLGEDDFSDGLTGAALPVEAAAFRFLHPGGETTEEVGLRGLSSAAAIDVGCGQADPDAFVPPVFAGLKIGRAQAACFELLGDGIIPHALAALGLAVMAERDPAFIIGIEHTETGAGGARYITQPRIAEINGVAAITQKSFFELHVVR